MKRPHGFGPYYYYYYYYSFLRSGKSFGCYIATQFSSLNSISKNVSKHKPTFLSGKLCFIFLKDHFIVTLQKRRKKSSQKDFSDPQNVCLKGLNSIKTDQNRNAWVLIN